MPQRKSCKIRNYKGSWTRLTPDADGSARSTSTSCKRLRPVCTPKNKKELEDLMEDMDDDGSGDIDDEFMRGG